MRQYLNLFEVQRYNDITNYNYDKVHHYTLMLSFSNLTSLKGSPREVHGAFSCQANDLTTLEYCPEYVSEYFDCSDNQITSLEHGPKYVGGYYDAGNNELTTLKGAPKVIQHRFVVRNNKLTTLEGGPEMVYGDFECSNNHLTSLKGCPKKIEGKFYCDKNPNLTPWEMRYLLFSDIEHGVHSDKQAIDNLFRKFIHLSINEKQENIQSAMEELKAIK